MTVKRKKSKEKSSVVLPYEPSKIATELDQYSILVHGEKKIGKTTLFSKEEMSGFFMWEPKQQAVSIRQMLLTNWPQFLGYLKKMEVEEAKGKLLYKHLVWDGVDLAFKACFRYTCKKIGIEHPSDVKDFGKSWNMISENFQDAVLRSMRLRPTRFICHSVWKEVKDRNGIKFDKLVPGLTGQAEEALIGPIDIWAAYCYDGKDRVLVIEGDEATGAGHRLDEGFLTPEGKRVKEIYMGNSSKDALINLNAAFKNEQIYRTIKEYRKLKKKGAFNAKKKIKQKKIGVRRK